MRTVALSFASLLYACGPATPAPLSTCDAAPLPAATARVGQHDGGALLPNGDGLAPAGNVLYASMALSNEVQALDPLSGVVLARRAVSGSFPHALLLAGGRLYIAEFGAPSGKRNRVEVFDATTLHFVASYPTGKN